MACRINLGDRRVSRTTSPSRGPGRSNARDSVGPNKSCSGRFIIGAFAKGMSTKRGSMRHRSGHRRHQAVGTNERTNCMDQRVTIHPSLIRKAATANQVPGTWYDSMETTEGLPNSLALEDAPNTTQARHDATPEARQLASSSSTINPVASRAPTASMAPKAEGATTHEGRIMAENISSEILRLMDARPKPPPSPRCVQTITINANHPFKAPPQLLPLTATKPPPPLHKMGTFYIQVGQGRQIQRARQPTLRTEVKGARRAGEGVAGQAGRIDVEGSCLPAIRTKRGCIKRRRHPQHGTIPRTRRRRACNAGNHQRRIPGAKDQIILGRRKHDDHIRAHHGIQPTPRHSHQSYARTGHGLDLRRRHLRPMLQTVMGMTPSPNTSDEGEPTNSTHRADIIMHAPYPEQFQMLRMMGNATPPSTSDRGSRTRELAPISGGTTCGPQGTATSADWDADASTTQNATPFSFTPTLQVPARYFAPSTEVEDGTTNADAALGSFMAITAWKSYVVNIQFLKR